MKISTKIGKVLAVLIAALMVIGLFPTHAGATSTCTLAYNANGGTGELWGGTPAGDHPCKTLIMAASAGTLSKPGHTFAGWNTQANGGGTSFAAGETLSLTGDVTLYAQYSPNAQTYTVNYFKAGTAQSLRPSEVKDALYGDVININAENVNIAGYDIVSTMPAGLLTIGADNSQNVISIYYRAKPVCYDVYYVLQGDYSINITSPDLGLAGDTDQTVTADAKEVPGYTPVSNSGSATLAWGETNAIYIEYTTNAQTYSVNYYKEGTTDSLLSSQTKSATTDAVIDVNGEEADIIGYSIVRTDPGTSLTVRADNSLNVINIYYSADAQSYTVYYYLENTTDAVAPQKAGMGVTAEEITEQPIEVEGYEPVSSDSRTITLGAGENAIIFYYKLIDYSIMYNLDGGAVSPANPKNYNVRSGELTLNNPQKAGYTFTGWTGTGLPCQTMTVTIPAGSTGDRAYTAHFTADEQVVLVNIFFYYDRKKTDYDRFSGEIREYYTDDVLDVASLIDFIAWIFPKPGYDVTADPPDTLIVGADPAKNVINIYFTPQEQSYTVYYYIEGTTTPLAPEKVGTGAVFEEIIEYPIDIDGYEPVDTEPWYITLWPDDMMEEGDNTITFYYRPIEIVEPTPPLGSVETPAVAPSEIVNIPEETAPNALALPLTGENPLDWMLLAGGLVLAAGTLLLVSRKREQGEK